METTLEKLARLYVEGRFSKEEMAKEMFENGSEFGDVVRVSRIMDKIKG